MQPTAVVIVLVIVVIFAIALLAYCAKRMGRDVFISQSYNIITGKLSEPSRPLRRRLGTPPVDATTDVDPGGD